MSRHYDVIVVGCGPVGAYAANLFGRAGLRTLVLDRDTAPYALPRAVHLDHEMVRLLADIGVWDRVQDQMLAADGHLHIGADGGMIRYLSAVDGPKPFGHANDYFFYQPELEAALRAGLARFETVTLRLGAEVTGVTQTDDRATVVLQDGEALTADWVIGCDGARSAVRKSIGIALNDLYFEEPWLVIDAEVDGPIAFPPFRGVPDEANLQRLSVMLCDPARPATIVPGRGNHRRWEFMLLPGESDADMARPETAEALVAPWVAGAPCRIIRAATYRFHGLVADRWRLGRVFLAGDAAHQTPPFFGQGMCHGLRDASNLGWKLALVQRGAAVARLLDTYQTERDPQVRHVISRAIEVGRTICILDPDKAAQRDAEVRSQTGMRTAAELIAPIRSDIVAPGAGERFINPRLATRFLDEATGGGWVLLHKGDLRLAPGAQTLLEALGAKRFDIGALTDPEGHLSAWFAARGATAALIRPDFYLAAAGDGPGLSRAIRAMGDAMGLAPTSNLTDQG